MVEATQPLDEGARRECTLGDGAKLYETLVSKDDMSYTYKIDESPLPLANYQATISVRADGAGSTMEWSANFEADGVPEAEAQQMVGGIFQAGFDAL